MKKFSSILAVLFTLATTGQAFAFDSALQSNAMVYFAIPFGATSKADATPRFGFNLDYSMQARDGHAAFAPQPVNSLDFRLNIDGDASVYSNGVNLTDRLNALYASDEDVVEGYLIPLGVIGIGVLGFALAKSIN